MTQTATNFTPDLSALRSLLSSLHEILCCAIETRKRGVEPTDITRRLFPLICALTTQYISPCSAAFLSQVLLLWCGVVLGHICSHNLRGKGPPTNVLAPTLNTPASRGLTITHGDDVPVTRPFKQPFVSCVRFPTGYCGLAISFPHTIFTYITGSVMTICKTLEGVLHIVNDTYIYGSDSQKNLPPLTA